MRFIDPPETDSRTVFPQGRMPPAQSTSNSMVHPQQSQQSQQSRRSRNKASTRKNWAKAEQYLTEVEKAHGFARSWQLREQLERGDATLEALQGR